jgi:3-oxoacyl-[acyl-carrier protein] reductase
MTVAGKSTLVTGGGSGIGRTTAVQLADHGADVAIVDIDVEAAEGTADAIDGADAPGDAIVVEADVAAEGDVRRAIERTVDAFGSIDVLHNNAAAPQRRTGRLHELPDGVWDRQLGVNFKGAVFGAKHAIPRMLEQGGGAIVNTASTSGLRMRRHLSAYGPVKGGLVALTKQLALDYASDGIRVNAVAPVATDTPMFNRRSEEEIREFVDTIPMGRLGTPEDMAAAVRFLASDDSSFVTGVCLPVDGGYTV